MSGGRTRIRRLMLRAMGGLLPTSRSPRGRKAQPRLLLIRPDHLGDVLLTSPAVAVLRQTLPHARLTFLVGRGSEEVARRGSAVDEILTCDFPGFTRRSKRHALEPYLLLLREASRHSGRYDVAVVLRPDHWWGALLAALAGIPDRLGYETPETRPFLTEAMPPPPRTHSVKLGLALASRAAEIAGGPVRTRERRDPTPGPTFHLRPEERAWAAALLEDQRAPFVLLHPGSGSSLKNWPAERWAAVADALAARGMQVAISGGQDDSAVPQAVARSMRTRPILLAGRTSLGQLGALAERARLVLGTDSGPLHLAAALGTPTMRLYGPTDEAVYGPWGRPELHRTLSVPLPCRPCGNLASPPCGAHEQPPCLLGLETARVVAAALEILEVRCASRSTLAARSSPSVPARSATPSS